MLVVNTRAFTVKELAHHSTLSDCMARAINNRETSIGKGHAWIHVYPYTLRLDYSVCKAIHAYMYYIER